MKPYPNPTFAPEQTLDPADWNAFRAQAHRLLDAAVDRMERYREGPVWTALPQALQADYQAPLPSMGIGPEATQAHMEALLPYGVGNTHPRFFGWVHGSGTPGNLMADITAAAINANLGGRDHGAMYVEKQVVNWCRELFQFPATSSGLIVSGTSIATVIALKAARDRCFDFGSRKAGLQNTARGRLVGYTSEQTHSCVARAFDILGLGTEALRKIAVNGRFEIDTEALKAAIAQDRAANLTPFLIVGTAGAVNVGAIDDLETLADIAQAELAEHGTAKLGALITQNCEQAAYLAELVNACPQMTLVAPVAMNICCFRYQIEGQDAKTTDVLNDEIVVQLQTQGIAAPSTTLVNGRNAIRVNITNHRTTRADLELLVREVHRIGQELLNNGLAPEKWNF